MLALAKLAISIWLTFCIESQSTHISERKYYESQSTLSIEIRQFSLLCLMESSEGLTVGGLWVKTQPKKRDWSQPNSKTELKMGSFGQNSSKHFQIEKYGKLDCQTRAQTVVLTTYHIFRFLVGTVYTSIWREYVSSVETMGICHSLRTPTY